MKSGKLSGWSLRNYWLRKRLKFKKLIYVLKKRRGGGGARCGGSGARRGAMLQRRGKGQACGTRGYGAGCRRSSRRPWSRAFVKRGSTRGHMLCERCAHVRLGQGGVGGRGCAPIRRFAVWRFGGNKRASAATMLHHRHRLSKPVKRPMPESLQSGKGVAAAHGSRLDRPAVPRRRGDNAARMQPMQVATATRPMRAGLSCRAPHFVARDARVRCCINMEAARARSTTRSTRRLPVQVK